MVIIGIVVLIFAYRLFVSTRFGRRVADRVKLKIPVFGKLHHKICMARFSRTMGTLLTSGVPILQAMETVAGTVGNTIMSDALMEARARIREGDRIGDPLEASRLFPPMVVHMIGVGEESGSLDFMLQKIADFYESEVEAALGFAHGGHRADHDRRPRLRCRIHRHRDVPPARQRHFPAVLRRRRRKVGVGIWFRAQGKLPGPKPFRYLSLNRFVCRNSLGPCAPASL